ncbi:MAG TPA: hypothetical protein VGO67_02905 [Verrucomicrobiae bacterium]
MKKSTLVTLVLSGALVTGCDDRRQNSDWSSGNGEVVTNNTHVSGLGYYHAPYHGWFEYPYNFYRPGFGYYHGGLYSPEPFVSDVFSSTPSMSGTFGRGYGGGGGFGGSSSSISRGGFGSIGHGGGGGE